MSFANSHEIVTNQDGLNENLTEIVNKHIKHEFRKPYHPRSIEGFKQVEQAINAAGKPVIFDSCCGVGDSTINIAKSHPDHFVIGMDKSGHRLSKNEAYEQHGVDNFMLLRTDLNDFWRLAVDAQLDDIHRQILNFEFDPCDVPSSSFILAGRAWKLCRQNAESDENFGFRDFKGLAFIKGSLIRDLYALSKFEMHTWDTGWGILPKFITPISGEWELTLLDELAEVSCSSDSVKALKLVKSCNEIRLPSGWDCSQFPTLSELYASL